MAITDDMTLDQALDQATKNVEIDGEDQYFNEEQPEKDSEVEDVEEVETKEGEENPQEDDSEENPLEKISEEELPTEELKQLRKNLYKGFTEGRQRDAEKVKQAEERVRELEERLASLESSKTSDTGDKTNGEPLEIPQFNTQAEYLEWLTEQKAKQVIEQERQKLEEQKVNEFADKARSDYRNADPRLDENSEQYNKFMDKFLSNALDELYIEHVNNGGKPYEFDYSSNLSSMIEDFDNFVSEQQKQYLSKQSKKLRENSRSTRKIAPKKTNSNGRKTNMDLDESIEAAFENSI